ncbi:MAG: GrdX family protein [Bacillota bacterium]
MNCLIVTNNPLVAEKYQGKLPVVFKEKSVDELLVKVRDMVHQGYTLVSHPLPASLKLLFAPYRSVIVAGKSSGLEPLHVETIENSIIKYRKHMLHRKIDSRNDEDYRFIDLKLTESALNS